MNWNDVWAVIRREYLQRIRSRAFVISTIVAPLFMAGVFLVPMFFANRTEARDRRILVVDETGVLHDRLATRLEDNGWTVAAAPPEADTSELRRRVTSGEIGGFLVLDGRTLATGELTLYAEDQPSPFDRLMLRTSASRAALEAGLERSGIDADAMLDGGELHVELLAEEATTARTPDFWVAYIGAFFLYIVILMYAVAVMRATLEEKTSRIVEVIVSSMKPWHLMLGKILGVGAVSLTQLSIWLLTGTLLGSAGLPAMVAARPDLSDLSSIREALPGVGFVALFVAFFLLGFFMYSGLYACVGAMCNTHEEAQQAQAPLVVFLVGPILLLIPVIQSPSSTMATSLSLFPLFSPILMWARAAGGGAPAWQVGLSMLLMTLSVVAIAWVAGRIYSVGILMTGKRPTLPELWRWVKEA
ncbi:MAG: ABC transporter permease [Gemmatimonadales bacterium]